MIRYENSMKIVKKKKNISKTTPAPWKQFCSFLYDLFKKNCPHIIFVHNETQATAVKRCPQCELLNTDTQAGRQKI